MQSFSASLVVSVMLVVAAGAHAQIIVPEEPPVEVRLTANTVSAINSVLADGDLSTETGPFSIFTIGPSNSINFTATATSDEGIIKELQIQTREQIECTNYSNDDRGHYTLTRPWSTTRTSPTYQPQSSQWLFRPVALPGSTSYQVGGACNSPSDTVLRRNIEARAVVIVPAGLGYRTSKASRILKASHVVSLRVATYNINWGKWFCPTPDANWFGCSADGVHNAGYRGFSWDALQNGEIATKIMDRRPDIVVIQEVGKNSDFTRRNFCRAGDWGSIVNQYNVLRDQLGMYISSDESLYETYGGKGQAVYSNIPMEPPSPYWVGTNRGANPKQRVAHGVLKFAGGRRIGVHGVYLNHDDDDSAAQAYDIHLRMQEDIAKGWHVIAAGDLNADFSIDGPAKAGVPALYFNYCNAELAGEALTPGPYDSVFSQIPGTSHFYQDAHPQLTTHPNNAYGIDHVLYPVPSPLMSVGGGTCGYGSNRAGWITKRANNVDYRKRAFGTISESTFCQQQAVKDDPDYWRRAEPSTHPMPVVTLEYVTVP